MGSLMVASLPSRYCDSLCLLACSFASIVLKPNISKTAGDGASVPMEHL